MEVHSGNLYIEKETKWISGCLARGKESNRAHSFLLKQGRCFHVDSSDGFI